ncbi:hypothetical protein NQ317_019245 [Molorchus minor]|uniref:Uncharacterized protein n=1 Tax=Molorchus minor TaxID=1323400 RepID=A0ABQ9JQ06_9CUCU|nr:hypothetical protein NQ317_019245 [Molorchus minor]
MTTKTPCLRFSQYFRVRGIDYDYSQSDPSTPDHAQILPNAMTIVFKELIATIPEMIQAFPTLPELTRFCPNSSKCQNRRVWCLFMSTESIATIPEMIRALPTFPVFARTLPKARNTVFGVFPYIFGCRESITTIPETIRALPIFPELFRSINTPYEESIGTVPVAIRELPNLTTDTTFPKSPNE